MLGIKIAEPSPSIPFAQDRAQVGWSGRVKAAKESFDFFRMEEPVEIFFMLDEIEEDVFIRSSLGKKWIKGVVKFPQALHQNGMEMFHVSQ